MSKDEILLKKPEHNARSDILTLASCVGCLQDVVKDELYGYEITERTKRKVLRETEEITLDILHRLDEMDEVKDFQNIEFMTEIRVPEDAVENGITVPCEFLADTISDMYLLIYMHKRLISYYEKESELKKHHKAYLHVRDEADRVCNRDKEVLQNLLKKY